MPLVHCPSFPPSFLSQLQMLSYCWSEQPLVIALKHALTALGYSVWLDLEQMQGSTLAAMADAVERAAAVVVVFSRRYRESANCRSEAEFAYTSAKHIVPVKAESGYRADGWLGLLIGAKLYFDMSSAHPLPPGRRGAEPDPSVCPAFADDATASLFCEKVRALVRELGPRGRFTPGAPFCAPVAVSRGSGANLSSAAGSDVRAGPILAAPAGTASPSVNQASVSGGGAGTARSLVASRSSGPAQLGAMLRQHSGDSATGSSGSAHASSDARSGATTGRLARPSSFVIDARATASSGGIARPPASSAVGIGPSSSPPPPASASSAAGTAGVAALPPLRAFAAASTRLQPPAGHGPTADARIESARGPVGSARSPSPAPAATARSSPQDGAASGMAGHDGSRPAGSPQLEMDNRGHVAGAAVALELPSLSPEHSSVTSLPEAARGAAGFGVVHPTARPLLSAPSLHGGSSTARSGPLPTELAASPQPLMTFGRGGAASPPSAAEAPPAAPDFPSLDHLAAATAQDVHAWAAATTGLATAADLLLRQGIDGVALLELRRLLASDEGLLLKLLKEDVGVLPLGHRMRIVAALRSLSWGDGTAAAGGAEGYE